MKKVKIESANPSNLLAVVSKLEMKKVKKESVAPSNLLAVVSVSK